MQYKVWGQLLWKINSCFKLYISLKPSQIQSVRRVLLLLLGHFSRVRLCATPETAAHQAPPSLGFSRQEHWSGLPFPSPMQESEKWKWSLSVTSNSQRPHGLQPTRLLQPWIVQARVLEWVAIAFSDICIRIWYLSFSFWLYSLCIIDSRSIHLIRTDSNVFLSMTE